MKVALVVTNLAGGGAERAFLRIGALLAGRGHEVHLLLLESVAELEVPPGIAVHGPAGSGAVSKGFFGKHVAARSLRRRFASLARTGAFDLVLSTLPFADEVAALARLPRRWQRIANTLSAEIAALSRSPRKAARRLARYRRLYAGANLVVVADDVGTDLRDNIGVGDANIVRLCNPFDFDAIRRLAAAPAAGIPQGPYVVHAGRFVPQKRHDVLLDAWRRHAGPETLVLLTRRDPALEAMIAGRGLGGRVMIAGFQANPYPWIARARALVLASDREGMPNVLVEALICGTPVVSTDCPSGPRELLQGELARWLVPTGDPVALAAKIAEVLRERPSIGAADLSRFDAKQVAAELERLPSRWREPSVGRG